MPNEQEPGAWGQNILKKIDELEEAIKQDFAGLDRVVSLVFNTGEIAIAPSKEDYRKQLEECAEQLTNADPIDRPLLRKKIRTLELGLKMHDALSYLRERLPVELVGLHDKTKEIRKRYELVIDEWKKIMTVAEELEGGADA